MPTWTIGEIAANYMSSFCIIKEKEVFDAADILHFVLLLAIE